MSRDLLWHRFVETDFRDSSADRSLGTKWVPRHDHSSRVQARRHGGREFGPGFQDQSRGGLRNRTLAASASAYPALAMMRSLYITNVIHYYAAMIRSFADKLTAAVFDGHRVKALPPQVQDVARRKLKAIDAAKAIDDLRVPPGNRLERLARDRKGQWSIRINDQWRACFRWENGDAHDVQVTDYH